MPTSRQVLFNPPASRLRRMAAIQEGRDTGPSESDPTIAPGVALERPETVAALVTSRLVCCSCCGYLSYDLGA